jgi:hypothetical protein
VKYPAQLAPLRPGFSFAAGCAFIGAQVICSNTFRAMIEIMIERWTNAEGKTDFRWSVWSDGHRIQIGPSLHSTVEDSEAEAHEFCWRDLGHKPDKVTRL